MSILADALVTAFFLTATAAAGLGFWWSLWPPDEQRTETLTDRWRKLTEELPK
jgi:hypothetical protein